MWKCIYSYKKPQVRLVLQNEKRAFNLTNFKHETMLTQGVTLLIEVLQE